MFNDHDHFAPIIEEFAKNGHNIKLVTLLYSVNDNYILEYLKDKYGLTVEKISYDGSKYIKICMLVHQTLIKINFKKLILERLKGRFITKLNKILLGYGIKNSNRAIGYINKNYPDVIIADRTNLNNKSYSKVFLTIRKMKIPIIRMTHGIPTFSLIEPKSIGNNKLNNCINPDCDIWTGLNEKMIYKNNSGIIAPKNPILGSARFSNSWMKNYTNLLSYCVIENIIEKKIGIVNVLILMESEYKIETTDTVILIEKMLGLRNIVVHIKPHTRDRVGSVKSLINMQKKFNNLKINRENTVYLMRQCDVIFHFSSSVAIHGYLNNYIMINLSYLCNYKTIYSDYGMGCNCNSIDMAIELLNNYIYNGQYKCLNDSNANKFFNDTIGPSDTDAIQENYKYIVNSVYNEKFII